MVISDFCEKCFNKKKSRCFAPGFFYCFKVNDHAEEYLNDLFPL